MTHEDWQKRRDMGLCTSEQPHDCAEEMARAILASAQLRRYSEQVYGPDGVPLDGPRDTAAYLAGEVSVTRDPQDRSTRQHRAWRDAAAYEGERYSEAIRGGRAMFRPDDYL